MKEQSLYRVAQNKPDYSTFQPSLQKLHKLFFTLVAQRQIREQKRNVHLNILPSKYLLGSLYYSTGHYQTVKDHSTLVTDHSQCSSHVVQGELLPKIDDNIDTVLGLSVFYQHVRTAALNQQQQTQHVSVFTTELFARTLSADQMSVVYAVPPFLTKIIRPR